MKRITIPAILAAGVLAFSLVGCGGPAKSVDKSALQGFWVLEKSAQVGFDAVLDLDSESYAELIIADVPVDGVWSTDGKTAKIEFGGGVEFDSVDTADGVEVVAEGSGSAASASSTEAASAASASAEAAGSTQAASGSAASAEAAQEEESEPVKVASIYVSDGKLVLGDEKGSKLVFVKGNAEEYYEEQGLSGEENLQARDEVRKDIKAVSVADDDTCAIKVTAKGTDGYGYPYCLLSIKNKTNGEIEVDALDGFKVNDKVVYAELGSIIEPNETIEMPIYFEKEEVGDNVDNLKNITGNLAVYTYDSKSDEPSEEPVATYELKVE